ncbi:MAG: LPXTG cell wall anchor domain-containing protein, partial [Oscillospiraceae bacterium]|nr:LPXTG cell wall anchor domain-containing protein [Oscillospiraceae bacterium]
FENEAYKGIIQIIKKDAATGEVLSGVEFGLFDIEGNEIARGKTDDAGVLLFEQIRFGKYEIRELTPKEGYQKNETVTPVEITEDGQTVTVELTNEKIPEPVIPDNPKTGDESNIFLWFGLLIASLLGMVAVFIFRRRANAQ